MVQPFMSGTPADVATKLLYRTVDDLYDFLKDKIAFTIDKSRLQRKIPELVNRINSYRMVKTLWQMDFPVDVEQFYCSSYVLIPKSTNFSPIGRKSPRKRKMIDSVSDFDNIGNIIIKGIAGQGKSIFLRHLFIREFEHGQRIPVFIELRKIQKDESLLSHISQFLDILDLKIDSRLFRLMARSGKFVFFLDAYDEVPEKEKQKILNELEYLVGTSPGSQFIVTTRPDSGIEMSTLFTITTLDDLKGNEYQSVIRKLSGKTQSANNLIKAIKSHKATVVDLLCTPLLVTLLIIQYASYQKLPEQMSDFFESIFDVLLHRHDRSKPGFVRKRLCGINDNQYREVFNAFCFESIKIDKSQLSSDDIHTTLSRAMKLVNVDEDPLKYLNDITRITCLLLHEGEEYRFIHKSVREYYAASLIKSIPEGIAKSFYTKYIEQPRVYSWRNVIFFLSEMDKYRYTTYFLLPLCRFWLKGYNDDDLLGVSLPMPTLQQAIQIVGPMHVSFDKKGASNKPRAYYLYSLEKLLGLESPVVDRVFELDFGNVASRIRSKDIRINNDLVNRYYYDSFKIAPNPNFLDITFEQLINEGIMVEELISLASITVETVYSCWRSAYDYVKNQDSVDILVDFMD